mgnify:CR=1 FL=1
MPSADFAAEMVTRRRPKLSPSELDLLSNLDGLSTDAMQPVLPDPAHDDPALDPIFDKAGELGLPIAIHVGDPQAFWQEPGPANERHEELDAHPEWSFYADYKKGRVPAWRELYDAFIRRVARHPKTTFIGVHFGNAPEEPDLVAQALDRYPTAEGTYRVPFKMATKLPRAEAYLETECPRGQMGFYLVSDGSSIPWRVRARSSCFSNLCVTHELCRGCLIADVPAIVGSIDIVMGEIDR